MQLGTLRPQSRSAQLTSPFYSFQRSCHGMVLNKHILETSSQAHPEICLQDDFTSCLMTSTKIPTLLGLQHTHCHFSLPSFPSVNNFSTIDFPVSVPLPHPWTLGMPRRRNTSVTGFPELEERCRLGCWVFGSFLLNA